MSRLEEAYAERGRTRTALRAVFLLLGGVVGLVGFASATASLVAGFGYPAPVALKVALALAGGLLPVAYLVLLARVGDADPHRPVAALGLAVAAAGLAAFWVARPGGWGGDPAALPPAAVGTYAAGLLAVFGSLVAPDESDGSGSERPAVGRRTTGVRTTTDRDETPSLAASADGGTDDDELTFLDE